MFFLLFFLVPVICSLTTVSSSLRSTPMLCINSRLSSPNTTDWVLYPLIITHVMSLFPLIHKDHNMDTNLEERLIHVKSMLTVKRKGGYILTRLTRRKHWRKQPGHAYTGEFRSRFLPHLEEPNTCQRSKRGNTFSENAQHMHNTGAYSEYPQTQ